MTEPADNPLLQFLLAVLASVMAPALDDPGLARRAAQQAIEACQPQGMHELMLSGQILAFAMTALEALRLAATPDISLSMQVKLRGNANGLNRAARDNTRILDTARQATAAQARIAAWQEPEPPPDRATADAPSPGAPPASPSRADWAGAMHRVAARLRAGTPRVAPLQRSVDALWIGTLNGVAAEIARADAVRTEPDSARRTGKAALLRTTRLATDPGFPPPLRTLGEPAAATL